MNTLEDTLKEIREKFDDKLKHHDEEHFVPSGCEECNQIFHSFLTDSIHTILQTVRENIEAIPDTYPELQSDEYDTGMKDMKAKVLAITSIPKEKEI